MYKRQLLEHAGVSRVICEHDLAPIIEAAAPVLTDQIETVGELGSFEASVHAASTERPAVTVTPESLALGCAVSDEAGNVDLYHGPGGGNLARAAGHVRGDGLAQGSEGNDVGRGPIDRFRVRARAR